MAGRQSRAGMVPEKAEQDRPAASEKIEAEEHLSAKAGRGTRKVPKGEQRHVDPRVAAGRAQAKRGRGAKPSHSDRRDPASAGSASGDASAQAQAASKGENPAENGQPPGSRHYRRARRDRGAETRAQLIEAALDVFGRQGFEGATTREIAKTAGANLAAIVYHFGSKEALHIAVAEHVSNRIATLVGPALAAAADPAAAATPATARAMFERLIETYVEVMVGSAEAERWARFIVREQMQPSAAFDVIYRVMGGSVGIATRLVATALGRPEDEEIRLRAFAMFGQVLVFRVAQALVLRRMGWTAIGDRERAEIKRVVRMHIDAILSAGGP